jgi:nucleotidyltransferase substrate binding protein (TIGR01987 family)
MADLAVALANLERAFGELESYLTLPVRHARDKAGLIQGFEFTFELFWKTFQKLAPDAGLDASSPREALAAAVNLHLITLDESPHWAQMLRDRNLTSHTYNANVADEILARLMNHYVSCFRSALQRLRASLETPAGARS